MSLSTTPGAIGGSVSPSSGLAITGLTFGLVIVVAAIVIPTTLLVVFPNSTSSTSSAASSTTSSESSSEEALEANNAFAEQFKENVAEPIFEVPHIDEYVVPKEEINSRTGSVRKLRESTVPKSIKHDLNKLEFKPFDDESDMAQV